MEDVEPPAVRVGLLPKACDNCRIRKIRCDKASPCSSCRAANIPCKAANLTAKRPETHRPVAATYNEKQFNSIHQCLQDIKEQLRDLHLKSSNDTVTKALSSNIPASSQKQTIATGPTFLGESSFDNHSTQASLTAEVSARILHPHGTGSQVGAALKLLQTFTKKGGLSASSLDDLSFPQATALTPSPKLGLPPLSLVLAALKRATVHAPFVLLHSAQRNHAILEELCKKIYFPLQSYSKGEFTLMNGMLSFVFAEYSSHPDSTLTAEECSRYAKLCETNFIHGLQDYDCLVNPTLENIQCLMIGAMKAQEESRPALCWTFVSAGARLCQTIGLHREAVVSRDPPPIAESKRHAFWMLYMIDKTLSLNLGRPSCFPDHDIDVALFSATSDPRFRPWDHAFLAFIDFSKLQGKIYDDLYSVRAQTQSSSHRTSTVEELSAKFFAWHLEFKKISTNGAQDKSDLDLIVGSSDFIYYSALNLLYGTKVTPRSATHISASRYEAGRLSLQCHIENASKLSASDIPKWRIYADWILLYSSFTPFLVVFTHALVAHSNEDIVLLSKVLDTLEAPRRTTEALNRLYQICRVFLDFAKSFVPSNAPSFGHYNHTEDSFTFPHEGEVLGSNTSDLIFSADNLQHFEPGSDLESMSLFLDNCLGENSTLTSLWNVDFSNAM